VLAVIGMTAVLGALLGALSPPVAAQDAPAREEDAEPAEPAVAQPAPLPRDPQQPAALRPGQGPRTSEAARAFEKKLHTALSIEAQVQAYEQAGLGLEDPERLSGYKLERRLRLDRDREANAAGRTFAMLALAPPRPSDAAQADLGRRELTLLTNLSRAYESSRSDQLINQYIAANQAFLQSADWAHRDRAVVLRDKLVRRETAFTRLIEQANELLSGTVDEAQLAAMVETLAQVAPETREVLPDLSVLVIQDQALRLKVLTELQTVLARQPAAQPPPPEADKLLLRVNGRQQELVRRAELAPVIQEHMHVEAELKTVEAEILASVDSQDIEQRKVLTQRKAELTTRLHELSAHWFGTDPDAEMFPGLVQDQDALIRRMMLDLGPRGALFGARHDVVRELAAAETVTPVQRWTLLQAQQDLISALIGAQPEPDLLDGVLPLAALVKARPPPPAPVAPLAAPGQPKAGPLSSAAAKAKAGALKGAPKPKAKPKGKAKQPPPKKKPGGKQPAGTKPR
jgi:hypothetical protein